MFNGSRVSRQEEESIPKIDDGSGCTVLTCVLRYVHLSGKFYVYFTTVRKFCDSMVGGMWTNKIYLKRRLKRRVKGYIEQLG